MLAELIASARFYVREDTTIPLNGKTANDVILFAPVKVLGKIDVLDDQRLRERLRDDLNTCAASIVLEEVYAVAFEPEDDNDIEYQQSERVSTAPAVAPESVKFWSAGQIRLFVSHRDSHKSAARALSDALAQFGVSAFLAHDTIEPMTTWRDEVRKALNTMEVLLAFITDDFDDSPWTQQEVGYAIGKGVPIISLQMQRLAPSGFLEVTQAVKGRLEQPALAADDVYRVLAENLGNGPRLQGALIQAFATSPHFGETRDRFDRLDRVVEKLSPRELQAIISAFDKNDQLHNAGYLSSHYNRLLKFLERTTGRQFEFNKERPRIRMTPSSDNDDEIPF